MQIARLSRAAVAAALLLAVGAFALLLPHDRAAAEDPVVEIAAAPDLEWGFKATWRNYVQEPAVSEGAAVLPTPGGPAFYQLGWQFESGSYDPATRSTRLAYRGKVHWQKYRASELDWPLPPGYSGEPDPYILDVVISDPEITIDREGSALTAEVISRDRDTLQVVSFGRVPVVSLDVFGVTPATTGDSTAWSGIAAIFTQQGSAAFGNNYRPGQVVDDVSFSYAGPGGAPDFSETWDEPGTVALKLVQNRLYVENPTPVNVEPLWIDRENLIVHSSSPVTVGGVSSRRIEAFDLKAMEPVGEPLVLPTNQAPAWATSVAAHDTVRQRLLYRQTGEQGVPRWLGFNLATEEYERGQFTDPQMKQTAFIGTAGQRLAWDSARDRAFRVLRAVPDGVGEEAYDQHVWTLFSFEEGADGTWVKKAFPLPGFPAGQNATGYAPTNLKPTYATASDGSLIALAATREGLPETAKIPAAYRIVFNQAGTAVTVEPLPVEVLNRFGEGGVMQAIHTSPNGHIALIQNGGGSALVHCQIGPGGAIGCDEPVSIAATLEPETHDERRFAIDPADGSVWLGTLTSQKLALFKDGALVGAKFFKERHPKGGPVLVGDDHFVYAQTNDGSGGEAGGSKTWGFGKFERLGFVPTVTAQPQGKTVALAAGEESEAVSFGSTASGEPAPARQWQVKAPGSQRFVDVAGASGAELSVAATRADGGAEYRAVYSSAAGKVASEPARLSVEYAPLVRQQPVDAKVAEGADAKFALLAEGAPEPVVTWQRRVGGFWVNVGDEDESVVAAGNSLTVLGTNRDQSGALFRARVANAHGTVSSAPAKLTVTPKVTIPAGGVELDRATLEWSGSAELQKAPPFGGSNYFSAGVSAGDEASFHGRDGNAFAFQVGAGGAEALATWATRAAHLAGGKQLVRLYGGSGRVEEDGSATVAWDGAWSVSFYGGLAPFTLSDPVLSVDADGDGELSADLVGCASSMANPSICTPLPPAAGVTVASFSGVEVDPAGTLNVTPVYAGVEVTVPAGKAQQVRSGPGWGSWPQPFVDYHLQTGLFSYWYSSGGTADPYKAPDPFRVEFAGEEAPPLDDVPPPKSAGGSKPAPPAAAPPVPAVPVPPSIGAVRGVQGVGPGRRAKVATLRCPGARPCRVRAPRNAPVRIGGRTYWADVLAPASIPAGASATVRARLAPRALAALGGRRATLRVRLQVRSEEGIAKLLARVPIRRAPEQAG